jgi:hypothetical protein
VENKRYVIVIARTETRRITVELVAPNKENAEEAANDMAGDLDFNDGIGSGGHYEIESVLEKK